MPFGSIAASVAGGLLSKGEGSSKSESNAANAFKLQNNPFFNASFARGQNTNLGAAGPLADVQNLGVDNALLFGNQVGTNPAADLAGQQGLNFLQGLNAFDPSAVASQQFGLLSPLLNDQFQQDQLALENRQFAQGRLGSTGGANQFNALLDSQNDARTRALFDSFGQGLQAQQQQANLGNSLLQLNPQLRGLFQNLGTNSLNNALNIQGSANNLFSTLAGAAGGRTTQTSSFNPSQALGAGLLNAGVSGLSNFFGG